MGSPICVPWTRYPSPCASGVSANLRTVLRSWLGGRCCSLVSEVPLPSSYLNVPDGSGLQLNRCAGKDSSWQDVALLTSIHNAFWHWGELAVARLACGLRGGKQLRLTRKTGQPWRSNLDCCALGGCPCPHGGSPSRTRRSGAVAATCPGS